MQNVINNVQHEIKRGDIWVAELQGGRGSEQNMKRPILVLQNNLGNKYAPTVTIIPLTSSRGKRPLPTHVTLHRTICLTSLSIALAEQVSTISKERLIKFIGNIDKNEMFAIEDAVLIQCGIAPRNNIAYA